MASGQDAAVIPFPHSGEPHKTLRELREERGWSLGGTIRAMMACATPEEKKSLPDFDSLKRSWRRWEAGTVTPDRNRAVPFFQPIIARMFGLTPDRIWPVQHAERARTPIPRPALPKEYRGELVLRRNAVREAINLLQSELNYLDALLAIPLPAGN